MTLLKRLARRFVPWRTQAGAGLQTGNMTWSKRQVRELAMSFVGNSGIEGDYLEFGCFRGEGLAAAYHANQTVARCMRESPPSVTFVTPAMRRRPGYARWEQAVNGMRFFAFDSFAGLPEPTEPCEAMFGAGDYACTQRDFWMNLVQSGVDIARVRAVPGFFKDTLNPATRRKYDLRAAAVVYIDCDLYESTRQVLDFVTDLLLDGSVIVFGNWCLFRCHPGRGQQKAYHEWRAAHPELQMSPYVSLNLHSVIVHK